MLHEITSSYLNLAYYHYLKRDMWDKSKNVKFLMVRRRLKDLFLWCLSSHYVNQFIEANLRTLLICPVLSQLCASLLPSELPSSWILPPSVLISQFCTEVSWLTMLCCFWSVAKWVIQINFYIHKYIYIYILIYVFQILVHYNLLPDVECTSLCHRAGPCCLWTVLRVWWPQAPDLPPSPLVTLSFFLCVWTCSCFVHKFIVSCCRFHI